MERINFLLSLLLGLILGSYPVYAQLGGGAAGTAIQGMWDQIRGTISPEVLKKQSPEGKKAQNGDSQVPAVQESYRPAKRVPVKISVPAFSVTAPPAWVGYAVSGQENSVELIRAQFLSGSLNGMTQCSDCSITLRFFPYFPFVTAPSPGQPIADEQLHMFADVGIKVWAERMGLHGSFHTTATPITIDLGSGIAIKIASYPNELMIQKALERTNLFLVLRRPSGMLWMAIHAPSSQFDQIGDELDKVMNSLVFSKEGSADVNATSIAPLVR